MEKAKIDKINEYARRVKAGETLTEEELVDRAALRTEYLAEIRASMTGILDNTTVVNPDGSTYKLKDGRDGKTPKKGN